MANRHCFRTLTRHYTSILSSNPSLQSLETVNHHLQQQTRIHFIPLETLTPKFHHISKNPSPNFYTQFSIFPRHFCSNQRNETDDDESEEESTDSEGVSASDCGVNREYSLEEKEEEAASVGYKVLEPLQRSDRVFNLYESVYAVVQVGSHQFKVSNGDCIYTERLKFCEVNDKLILNRVLMLGSRTQTILGRPTLPDAAVHAVVEEHALDAKVIIFKKKRRKNYRRTKGHRQELTKLRITDIQGIEKPEIIVPGNTEKVAVKKVEKVAVAA